MDKILYFFGGIILLLFSFHGNAKPSPENATPSQNNNIQTIRAEYNAINNNQKHFKTFQKKVLGISSEGAEVRYFKDGKNLKKISLEVYGEMGKAINEIYFKDNKLIFFYNKDVNYDKPFGKVTYTYENRLYFYKDKLLRWIDNSKQIVNPNSKDYLAKEKEIVNFVRILKKSSDIPFNCVQIISDDKIGRCRN